jgi:hypothetical protein
MPTTKNMTLASCLCAAVSLAGTSATYAAGPMVIDLTHTIGTFAPKDGNIGEPDLSKPYKDSYPVPTFGAQAVYETLPDFKTNRGHFGLGRVVLAEHHGTHVDAPVHFNNTKETTESLTPDRRTLEQLGVADLFGPIVLIDLGSRGAAELDKNGGKPGPENVTDGRSSTGVRALPIQPTSMAGTSPASAKLPATS